MAEKTNISICLGSSCFAHGNNINLKFIQDYLKENNLNADVDFKGQFCSGLCGEGPIVTINDEVYKGVDKIKLAEILDKTFKHQ